jgi:hypothetical protein
MKRVLFDDLMGEKSLLRWVLKELRDVAWQRWNPDWAGCFE